MDNLVAVMDFSGAYGKESFYRRIPHLRIDCTGMEGVKGYCSAESEKRLREIVREHGKCGVHFIDSGSYHYLSKLWIEETVPGNIRYNLLLIDHHPDTKKPELGNILSCGSWAGDLVMSSGNLGTLYILGVDDGYAEDEIPKDWVKSGKVRICPESSGNDAVLRFMDEINSTSLPLYLSVDKDVLSSNEIITDWDNGSMRLESLTALLSSIGRKPLGIDICGECTHVYPSERDCFNAHSRVNESILKALKLYP